jgi:hypothetical protein
VADTWYVAVHSSSRSEYLPPSRVIVHRPEMLVEFASSPPAASSSSTVKLVRYVPSMTAGSIS